MNWLAHVFLSEQKVDFQIGNFLADPMKGRLWDGASDDMQKGVHIHQLIDSYTDSHNIVSQSKKRLRAKGLLKPVIIDLTYDYLLTKNWELFCSVSIQEYIDDFYHHASLRSAELPNPANTLVRNLIEGDRLNKYHQLAHLKNAFERIDTRLSERLLARENAVGYFDAVVDNISDIEEDFLIFFPQLCKTVKVKLDERYVDHWRI